MAYRLLTGQDALAVTESGWRSLEDRTGCHLFQTHDFCRLWLREAGPAVGAEPRVVAYEEDGELLGILPAAVVRYGPIRLTTWLGGPDLADYGDVLFDEASAGTSTEEFVLRAISAVRGASRGSFLYLTNVRDDSLASAALSSRLRPYKQDTAPYVTISGDFSDYLSSMSGNSRHNVRKAVRRMERAGQTRFRILSGDDPDSAEVLDTLVELKRARFGSAAFRPGYEAFRRAQVREEPHTNLACLTLDDAVIAADIVTARKGRMCSLMGTFDAAHSGLAPGKMLYYHLIRHCFENRLQTFDFGWGDESYKYQWAREQARLTTYVSDGLPGAILAGVASRRRKWRASHAPSGDATTATATRDGSRYG